jgi:hypothetical protein
MKYDVEVSYGNEKVIIHDVYATNKEVAKLIAIKMYRNKLRAEGRFTMSFLSDYLLNRIATNVKLTDNSVKEININTDGKIIMAFTDPVEGDENPYKYFTDNFTGEGVHSYFIFNTPEEFISKWLEIYNKPNGMWYWVLDGDKCICAGACDLTCCSNAVQVNNVVVCILRSSPVYLHRFALVCSMCINERDLSRILLSCRIRWCRCCTAWISSENCEA